MSDPTRYPPDFDDVLVELKREIFANLNCIQIGKITLFDPITQTAQVQIQVRRRIRGILTAAYPLLLDVPVVVLQGGGAYIEMPITTGDYCLVLFNDRNIDTWFSAGQALEPPTKRKHSLSDGIALVGLNPKTGSLGLVGQQVKISYSGNSVTMNASGVSIEDTFGNTISTSATSVSVNGNLEVLQ